MSTRLVPQSSAKQLLPGLSSESKDAEIKTRAGSASPMERRLSRAVSRRKSRPNTGSNRRTSNASLTSVTELIGEEKPSSPTVIRLKALAHAVRARHSLGIQKPSQLKYLLQASEAGTDETDVGVDLLMAGIQTNLKEDVVAAFTSKSRISNNSEINTSSEGPKSKVRFSNDDQSTEPSSTRNAPASSPRKPPLRSSFKSATMKRASLTKASLKRMNSIRGDPSAFMTPYHSKPRDAEVTLDHTQNFGARLTCAHSLYKLSCQAGSELAIITGGAIGQIADFSDVEDSKLLRYSAAVLANITTDSSMLEDFASKDGISALLELSWTPLMDVKVACTTALCRLSQSRARAAVLVRCRAITELMSMLTVPNVPLQQLVVSCIVNLVIYGHTFPDRVFVGDPQAVQSPLGLMNVLSQMAPAPATSQFAVEALFNLSLYRSSCLGVLRGGGAETLLTLVSQLCKLVDGSGGGSSSRYLLSLGVHAPAWTADMSVCMKLLRMAANTLANFSAFVEYHSMMSSHSLKALSLMLSGALRDFNNSTSSVTAEERFRCTGIACSRALVNFSSNVDLRRQNFPPDLIQLATKLALMDHQRSAGNDRDARTLVRNAARTLSNLSFESSCRTAFPEIPQLLVMLHAIAVMPSVSADEEEEDCDATEELYEGRMSSMTGVHEHSVEEERAGIVGSIALGKLSAPPVWYLRSSHSSSASAFPWTTDMSEDAKEDALVALLNLAHQPTYANDLLRTLDGKLLAAAAEDVGHSRRLRYIYASVLCNLLFDSYLQQIVFGDQVVRALVSGYNFFEITGDYDEENNSATSLPLPAVVNSEIAQFQALNLAFDDDQERFLASIFLITSELMDTTNIELVVNLVLPCMRAYMQLASSIPSGAPPSHPTRLQLQRQLPITCYASAALFALTRAATQRRDSQKHIIQSEEAEEMLIAVCALPSGSTGSGASTGASTGGITQAFCAATLYHMCASTSVNQRVIQGLINCCNVNEESQSLLACSAAFAIISFTPEGCQQLVQCDHLARALNRLGRTSQVECQQYAAIAACNVSTIECVWSSAELKDFIVVALLRANSIQAKQIHAKTLSNLLSHGTTRPKVVEDGVLYALMKLSQVMMSGTTATGDRRGSGSIDMGVLSASADEVFSIGLRALFNLSCDRQYHHKLLSNGIMAYLSVAVECKQPGGPSGELGPDRRTPSFNDPAITAFLFGRTRPAQKPVQQPQCIASHLSIESRRFALAIICNLASYDENHEELMRAQVAEVIRNYVDEDVESRASAVMALRNLSCRQPWVEMLCERKTLQLLILCTECDHPVVRQFAIEALANCSLVTDSLHLFGEMRVPRAVLTLLEVTANGLPATSPVSVSWELSSDHNSSSLNKPQEATSTSTYMAAIQCLHNISHDDTLALALMEETVILRLLPLLEYRALGNDVRACELVASLTHALAGKPKCAEALGRVMGLTGWKEGVNHEASHVPRPHVESVGGLRNSVLESAVVRAAIEERAVSHGMDIDDVERQAADMLSTMAAQLDYKSLRKFGWLLRKVCRNMYDQIHVDESGLTHIRDLLAERRGSVVLVPTHRSYVDFLLMSYVFFAYNIPVPYVAAGEDFLHMGSLTKLLRESGAYFIRRSFSDDPLYCAVFRAYTQYLVSKGHTIEFFIEGSRSRSGKQLHPKFGILNTVVDCYLSDRVKNLYIVPVTIDYEKPLEVLLHQNELLGEGKIRESISALLKAMPIIRKKFGSISVKFGDPLDVKQYVDATLARAEEQEVFVPTAAIVEDLGYAITDALIDNATCAMSHVVAAILLVYRQGISKQELVRQADWLRLEILRRGGRVVGTQGRSPTVVVDRALELLHELVTMRRKDLVEPAITSREQYPNMIGLGYYRNKLLHWFNREGVLACAYHALDAFSVGPGASSAQSVSSHSEEGGVDRQELLDGALFLHEMLAMEFVRKDDQEADRAHLVEALDQLETRKVLVPVASSSSRVETADGAMLSLLSTLMWPFIDSYWVAVTSLFALRPQGEVTTEDLLKRLQWLAETMYHEKLISFYESCSRETLQNALALLERWGVLSSRRLPSKGKRNVNKPAVQLLSLTPQYVTDGELEQLALRVSKFRKLPPGVQPATTSETEVLARLPALSRM